jgi:hypothetical protein
VLESFGGTVEVPVDHAELVTLEVTLPLYLVRWIRVRDRLYVARRLQAHASHPPERDEEPCRAAEAR